MKHAKVPTTQAETPPIPKVEIPSVDPMIVRSGLSEEKRAYLAALAACGHRDLAAKRARQQTGVWDINRGKILAWRKNDAVFAQLEAQVHGEYWDEFAEATIQNVKDKAGKKITGGEANLLMQQLNRAKPDEYVQTIVQKNYETSAYQVEAGFREDTKPESKPEVPVPAEAPTVQ